MNTKKIKTYRLIIKGKVQGVGFRDWFNNIANRMIILFMKNLVISQIF